MTYIPKNDNKIGPNAKFHRSAASAKTIRSITITFLVSTPNSKSNLFILAVGNFFE
jgi:hypothetical protein